MLQILPIKNTLNDLKHMVELHCAALLWCNQRNTKWTGGCCSDAVKFHLYKEWMCEITYNVHEISNVQSTKSIIWFPSVVRKWIWGLLGRADCCCGDCCADFWSWHEHLVSLLSDSSHTVKHYMDVKSQRRRSTATLSDSSLCDLNPVVHQVRG